MNDQSLAQIMADIDAILAQKALETLASILERHGATIPRPLPNEALEEMKRALNGYSSAECNDPADEEPPSAED